MMFPADDKLREDFARLTQQALDIRAKSTPLREQRDKIVNEARAKEITLNKQIAEIEAPLFEIEQTRAKIVRLLKGKTSIEIE